MIKLQKHIIQRVNVEVNAPDLSAARRIHDNIGELLISAVFPSVERQLINVPDMDDVFYRTEAVTVDLVFNSVNEMENDFLQSASAVLVKEINAKSLIAGIKEPALLSSEKKSWQIKTVADKSQDLLIYFLQTGKRPWYAANDELHSDEIISLLENNQEFRNKFKKMLQQYPLAAERLVKQFGAAFMLPVLEKISTDAPVAYNTKLKTIITNIKAEKNNDIKKQLLINLLNAVLLINDTGEINDMPGEESSKILENKNSAADTGAEKNYVAEDKKNIKESKKDPRENKKRYSPAEEEPGLFVRNAGIILLHPFLQYFFKEFGLLEGDTFKDEQAQELAVHLLHYLATLNEQVFEYNLLMEKFLCGIPQDQPVERFILLTDKMKNECSNLLKAAILHWTALKNTSPEGLQEGFLRRNGKLILSPQQNRLIIESTSIDILLEKLPWNYSIIQLPWMQQVLYVEWVVG